jgi:phosphoserine phosphatase
MLAERNSSLAHVKAAANMAVSDLAQPGNPTRFGSIVVDFDGTLAREHFLVQWVLFTLFRSKRAGVDKPLFLLRSLCSGIASLWLARDPSRAERAVRLAYKTLRGAEADSLNALVADRPFWKQEFALNLNRQTLTILRHLAAHSQTGSSESTKVVIWSQGTPKTAITSFLRRADVSQSLIQAGIQVDPADSDAILANQLIVDNGRFTGQLRPPVITKVNRLHLLPPDAVFVGDNQDEAAFFKLGEKPVRFINCQKIADNRVEQTVREFVQTI